MRAAGATHTGYRRERNEDAFLVQTDRGYWAVADGLGGHPAGDVASRLAIEAVGRHPQEADAKRWISEAIDAADAAVVAAAREDPTLEGMGTTLVVAAVADDDTIWIGNVGDSRAYQFDPRGFRQVTVDHADHTGIGKGFITRTIGSGTAEPDLYPLKLGAEERLLLCTDGLSDYVPESLIATTLGDNPEPQAACDALVATALDAGGVDNVAVVVLAPDD